MSCIKASSNVMKILNFKLATVKCRRLKVDLILTNCILVGGESSELAPCKNLYQSDQ